MFLPFSYQCDKSIEVYHLTEAFVEANDYEKKLDELTWAYHSIGRLIPHTNESVWSGHFFPWTESWAEYQISFNLCYFGFYKQAMISLRGALELGLLSVYWNLHDDGHNIIKEWLRSRKDTPYLATIWGTLEKHKNFQSFQNKIEIKSRVLNLGFLHDYVHSKGYKYSNRFGILKSNFQTFEAKAFKTWFEAFEEVTKVLSLLHLIKYPLGVIKFDYDAKFGIDTPSFGGINEFEVDRIAALLTTGESLALNEIAQQDEHVKEIMEWVSRMPDMTQEEIDEQMIKFDKQMIENEGLEHWLEQEQFFSETVRSDEKHKKRRSFLIYWAKENNFEKSKWEREGHKSNPG